MQVKSKYSHSPVTNFISPVKYWNSQDENKKIMWKKRRTITIGRGLGLRKIIVDFGKEVGGYLKVHWGKVTGGNIRFFFSESLEELEPGGDVLFDPFFARTRLFCKHVYRGSGNEWWRAPLLRGGFRYLLVDPDLNVNAEIKDIKVEADFYIPEDGIYPGFFECSDKLLNRIWYAAAYTMQVATKHPWESFVFGCDKAGVGKWVIFDGAKRDRVVWGLDLSISIPSYLYSLWNKEAVRNSLLTLLSQKNKGGFLLKPGYIPHSAFPTNRLTWLIGTFSTFSVYVMWWIRGVYFYYLHTGDSEFVKSVFKDINDAIMWLETQTLKSPQSRTPLFFANGFNDLSWDYTINRFGFSGATNIVWAKTFEEAGYLAENVIHNKILAKKYKQRASAIRHAVFEDGFVPYNLWDKKLGRFRHTTMEDKPFTLEVNAQAILFDFVRGKSANKLLDLIAKYLHCDWGSLSSDSYFPLVLYHRHNKKVVPLLVAYEVSALMKYGRVSEALDLTKKTWKPMLEQGTGTTYWEWYGDKGKLPSSFASLCHPWSAWILQVLTENLTGIKPVAGGFSLFELNPSAIINCNEIDNLIFHIPTPHGIIDGKWHADNKKIIYEINLPEEIQGKLILPSRPIIVEDIRGRKITKQSKLKGKIKLIMPKINK